MLTIAESLKKQREQILEEGSEESLSRHTSLLEIAIISLYNRLANRFASNTEVFRASGAVVAIGSFGRGLSSPSQPVSILCLAAEDSAIKESWLDEITAPLTEAGWSVEASQGPAGLLLERAATDFPFLLRLLELRYISGNRQLVDQFERALDSHIEASRIELLDQLYESVKSRQNLLDIPENWLEPDLVRNPGALSEIGSIRAGCRIASNIRNLEDAVFRGYLTRQEVDLLQDAEKTYTHYLSLLRSVVSRPESILRFDTQEALARKLGYTEKSGFLPVEIFMQRVHRLFQGVAWVSQEFWERLLESRSAVSDGDGGPQAEALEDGITVRSGKISIQTDRYPATPGHLVRLFTVAAKNRLGMANVTRQWVSHHKNRLDAASGDPAVKKGLFDLLRAETPEMPVLRRFCNYGLLHALIPELAPLQGLVQHDAFHLYPVLEHHLRTYAELKKLLSGNYDRTEPELAQIAQSVSDPALLLLAALLHDIGKSSGRGHALKGGEMVPAIARRLGLTPEESDRVQFLVSQHLLLIDSASMRDLADQEMVANCTLSVGSKEALDLLVLLTFADMMSTGPKARQKWRDTPVMPLYRAIAHILEKGEPSSTVIAERIARVKSQVETEVCDLMDGAMLDAYFSQLAPRYLLSMSPKAIARHLRLGRELLNEGAPFAWEVRAEDGTAEITVMSWERPGLLAQSAGILTLHYMNIMGAQVFTMNDGAILLVFQCRLPERTDSTPMRWDAVKKDMSLLLAGKLALDYRIAAHAAAEGYPQKAVRSAPSQILIDNESSGVYTILEVYTQDRIGLLYTIARALHELQIRIYVAKITTKNDQVADVFYVRTDRREKVTDPEQIEEIKQALRFSLDGQADWD